MSKPVTDFEVVTNLSIMLMRLRSPMTNLIICVKNEVRFIEASEPVTDL